MKLLCIHETRCCVLFLGCLYFSCAVPLGPQQSAWLLWVKTIMALGSEYVSGSEQHVSYPLALIPSSKGYVPTQAHSGGRRWLRGFQRAKGYWKTNTLSARPLGFCSPLIKNPTLVLQDLLERNLTCRRLHGSILKVQFPTATALWKAWGS